MTQGIREEQVRPKIEEIKCQLCQKIFQEEKDLQIHCKTKHASQNTKKDREDCRRADRKKGRSTKGSSQKHKKNKDVSEFQHHQDKIYSFLGQVGTRSNGAEFDDGQGDIEQSQDSGGKVGPDNNCMENIFIRLPFETELNVQRELTNRELLLANQNPFHLQLIQDARSFNTVVEAQKHKWQFMDPADGQTEADNKLSLSDVYSLNQNYRKRRITMHYPETTIFLLWLATFTRPPAWRQLTELLLDTRWKYQLYLRESEHNKTIWSWKQFFLQLTDGSKEKSQDQNRVTSGSMDEESRIAFLRLYSKWITLINPFN